MSRKNYSSRHIRGKLRVHHYLSVKSQLQSYLPYTASLTETQLAYSLNKYGFLYVKPNIGSQGKGIYQIRHGGSTGNYVLRSTQFKKNFKNSKSLYHYLKARTRSQMIVQQGIPLELVRKKPYDIRVMVQRKPTGPWTCTGIFTKVGLPKGIVTNYYQGGKIAALHQVFHDMNLSEEELGKRYEELSDISLLVAKTLHARMSGIHEMGIDFAYDRNGKLWILEVNTRRPQFHPLKQIDAAMYKRMMDFAKSYGRKHPN